MDALLYAILRPQSAHSWVTLSKNSYLTSLRWITSQGLVFGNRNILSIQLPPAIHAYVAAIKF